MKGCAMKTNLYSKDSNIDHLISWYILTPYSSASKKCNLCVKEKLMKRCYVIAEQNIWIYSHASYANFTVYQRWLRIFLSLKSPEEWVNYETGFSGWKSTYIHTYIHTYIYIYIHTHTHITLFIFTSFLSNRVEENGKSKKRAFCLKQ